VILVPKGPNAECHKEIISVLQKYGFVDFFYGGLGLMGEDICGARFGEDSFSKMNTIRKRNLVGLISEVIHDMNNCPKQYLVEEDKDESQS
jgi:hypothetical protein